MGTDERRIGKSSGVQAEIVGRCGRIVLDRPKALNALTLEMIRSFRGHLDRFADLPDVAFVMVTSSKAGIFCAGADVRAVRTAHAEGCHEEADAFFEEEFALNARIADYPKPYIALVDGVCLGGGMGLVVHGSHRVVGTHATLGMPETAIGYFPDVGASYFLNRLPRADARYIALTGEALSAADALYTGLADAFVKAEKFSELEARLAEVEVVGDLLVCYTSDAGISYIAENVDEIERCFAGDMVEDFITALAGTRSNFADKTLAKMNYASPASLRIALELLDANRSLSLLECLDRELVCARDVTRGAEFAEGVRALLVDKDRSPRWPSRS